MQGFCQNASNKLIISMLKLNSSSLHNAYYKQALSTMNVTKLGEIRPYPSIHLSPSKVKNGAHAHINKTFYPRQLSTSGAITSNDAKNQLESIPLTFYYDTLSPYSWLAFEILQRYRPIWNLDIDFKPVYMSGITKENNNKFLESLTGTPNRVQYIFKDLVRAGEFCHVPLRVPESPLYLLAVAGSLKQQRFLTAVKKSYPEYLESCSREFWYRCWSEDLDATKDSSIYMVASKAGLKEDEILNCLEDIQTNELKNLLKKTTSDAVNAGAFGLPFITIVRNKTVDTFWGSDRFEIMANSLRTKWHGPVPENVCYVPIPMPRNIFEKQDVETHLHTDENKIDFSLPNNFKRPPL